MRIATVISRLSDQCASLSAVLPAHALNAMTDIDAQLPIAYVHASDEAAEVSPTDLYTTQQVDKRIAVIVVAANLDTVTDTEQLEDVRDEVRAALLGYEIDSSHDPFEFVEGRVIEITPTMIWWRDLWATAYHHREA